MDAVLRQSPCSEYLDFLAAMLFLLAIPSFIGVKLARITATLTAFMFGAYATLLISVRGDLEGYKAMIASLCVGTGLAFCSFLGQLVGLTFIGFVAAGLLGNLLFALCLLGVQSPTDVVPILQAVLVSLCAIAGAIFIWYRTKYLLLVSNAVIAGYSMAGGVAHFLSVRRAGGSVFLDPVQFFGDILDSSCAGDSCIIVLLLWACVTVLSTGLQLVLLHKQKGHRHTSSVPNFQSY